VNRERLVELNQGSRSDPRQIAKALGVRYYVSGSYQRVGDDLKVVARLVEVEAGTIQLQESFTDRFTNLLHIEEDLAHRFAAALQRSPAAAMHVETASLPAYQAVAEANDLYLAGHYRESIERLERAIAQDERYADAWALLGKSYARLSAPTTLDRGARSDLLREALRASRRATKLAPSSYDAQVALAVTYQQLEQVESWRIAAQKAIDVNPRLPEAYVSLGDSYGPSPAYGCAHLRDPSWPSARIGRRWSSTRRFPLPTNGWSTISSGRGTKTRRCGPPTTRCGFYRPTRRSSACGRPRSSGWGAQTIWNSSCASLPR
jgi:tetratricopeptide (TPR) repeat protein